MKSTLHFNLPDERYEFHVAVNGRKYKDSIDSLYDQVFRPIIKYEKPIIGDELKGSHLEVVEAIWQMVNEHFQGCD
jgi:hypothetical protein